MKKNNKLVKLADRAGELRADISKLKDELDLVESKLKSSGKEVVDGNNYRVTISVFSRSRTGWKAIAEKLGASKKLIRQNTIKERITRLKVSALLS